MRSLVASLAFTIALSAPAFAAAEDGACQELRARGYETCFRQNDAARTECSAECARCGEEITACFSYCEHFCDAAYPEGCSFDLNACVSRCGHRCHEPACDENPGCKQTWCAPATVKQCSDTCATTYASLAGCRATWCADGKARAACINSCNSTKAPADACRKSWCGDGKSGQQCYKDADAAEETCRKQVDASVKACLAGKK
jgi:hypothetical protein